MGRLMQDVSEIAALLTLDGETSSSEQAAEPPDTDAGLAQPEPTQTGFAGLRVISFESRMAAQMTRLIERHNGKALVVPALREIPIPSQENAAVFRFGARLMMDQVDMLILLTGVGTRGLLELLQQRYPTESLVEAFSKIVLVSRGPKPAAALKSIGLTPNISVPEPNTWYDLLATLDEYRPVKGQRVVVQEYGLPNADLIEALKQRGAEVFTVPIYRWALPEDVQPLRQAVTEIVSGTVDVMLITNAIQVDHVMQIAEQAGQAALLKEASRHMVVAAIGPTASEGLRSHDLPVDLEPSHPKMGILVKETADRAASLLQAKRNPPHPLSR
jgi:uroporphyrinogen-III synthase